MMVIIFYSYHLVTMLKIIIGLIIIGKNKHLKQLKNIQRKPIKIRTKEDKTPLEKDLENAYCTVSYQSTVVVQSIMNGTKFLCK